MKITHKNKMIATLVLDSATSMEKNNPSVTPWGSSERFRETVYKIIDTKGRFNGFLDVYFKSYAKDEYCVSFTSAFPCYTDDVCNFDTLEDATNYIAEQMILCNQ